MRWFWQRRTDGAKNDAQASGDSLSRWRARARNRHPPDAGPEPHNAVMAFACGYLTATGARVRLEGDDLLSAALPGGETRRYTTTIARADAQTTLLTPGGHALAAMLDDTSTRARISSLRLTRSGDTAALARDALAQPSADCDRCATTDGGHARRGVAICETCPLRTGRIVLAGAGKVQAARITREWEGASVELTFRVSARDRGGRTDEWARIALDAESGRSVEQLTRQQIETAQPGAAPVEATATIQAAVDRAHAALTPALEAASIALRQRAAEAYRKRVEDVTATHERLRREQPDEARAIDAALRRELSALAEVYAVDTQAALESICFIATPMAEARLRLQGGAEVALTVDLGRGVVESLICGGCGTATRSAAICAQGHLTCVHCQPGCAACEGRVSSQRTPERPRAKPAAKKPSESLTVERLDALTPRMWRQCVTWLLEREGYVVEAQSEAPSVEAGVSESQSLLQSIWRGAIGERRVTIQALRLPDGWLVGPAEVQRAAALVAEERGVQALLLSPSLATDEARRGAEERGMLLWDREELRARLERMASEHSREEAQAHREAKERADAAGKTRAALLKAIEQATGELQDTTNEQRAIGHSALTAAIGDLSSVRQAAEQAFVAWETLIADWLAAFAERASRASALVIEANVSSLRDLRDRAAHLSKATRQIFERLAQAPADGEMGYGAWRAALIDEYRVRCAAYRARIEMVDPARWEDADHARSPRAEARAEHALREAKNAGARAAQVYAQLIQLTGAR